MTVFDRPGDYLDGRFEVPTHPDDEIVLESPADTRQCVGVHPIAKAHVDRAIEAARRAFPAFRRTPEEERRALLRRYQERLRVHAEAIAETIAKEIGKALWDARSEVQAMIGKVDLALGEGAAFTTPRRLDDLPGEIRYRPHGVVAVLGPFNFPGHLPNGQIVPALLLGNTVVFKPSDKGPGTAIWIARCFDEAGAPPGVFNVVQGKASLAEYLVEHPDLDGIFFTGSDAVGKRIAARNAERPGRILALELGGKNATIVLDDADVEQATRHIAFAAFASAGQRCTATSRVFVHRAVADPLIDRLADAARRAVIGYPFDAGVFSGPMISASARNALLEGQERARAAGYVAVEPGGELEIEGHPGHYVRPAVHRAPGLDVVVPGYSHDELFGPDVAVYVVDDVDQAIEGANATRFGLSAAVFTRSEAAFERAADALRVGVLHFNRGSAGASGRLPFGGVRDSGNHRPAGIMAGTFCSYPLAVLLPPRESALPSWPGLFA